MAYEKDSAIILIQTGEDGYFVRYFIWNESPPPLKLELATAIEFRAEREPAIRQDRVSEDKTNLKTELSALIDNYFDVT